MKEFDTIVAIATPIGIGGIAIIRMSGQDAEKIADSIVFAKNGKSVSDFESHKLVLSDIKKSSDGNLLDEALVSVMRAPNSYTGETVVEINCHGGRLSAELIIEELFLCGARQAEAGEFTRRAFVNGKCDLARAEAVIDVIHANSELGQSNAAKTLSGKLSEKVNKIRDKAIALASNLSAVADFPDEVEELSDESLRNLTNDIKGDIIDMLDGFRKGKMLRDGIKTVIVGRPNVGKSSLLNAMSRSEKAIVTDIPGTTRDAIEEYINVNGVSLCLIDTAGIHESDNLVEQIGINRARESVLSADLCLFVIDSSADITEDDLEICQYIKDRKTIVILNKTDKKPQKDVKFYSEKLGFPEESFVFTSTPKGEKAKGIDLLEEKITEQFLSGGISKDDIFISNDRQKNALIKAKKAIERMVSCIDCSMPQDLLYVDLEELIVALGEVTGMTIQEEIIDEVFERFCVGK